MGDDVAEHHLPLGCGEGMILAVFNNVVGMDTNAENGGAAIVFFFYVIVTKGGIIIGFIKHADVYHTSGGIVLLEVGAGLLVPAVHGGEHVAFHGGINAQLLQRGPILV